MPRNCGIFFLIAKSNSPYLLSFDTTEMTLNAGALARFEYKLYAA
jgi:hypothetical protein